MRSEAGANAGPAPEPASSTGIPLTIITGFLGAGKTTLLNRVLSNDEGRRIAVLVNDFGSVNIDAELVVGVEDGMLSLANGCICCEIRDDLLEAVERIVESDERPDQILLEASGIADPAGIWATFTGSSHPEWVRLDGVICVVDTEQVLANLDAAPDMFMFKARQIGFADLVILNKVDLAGPDLVVMVRHVLDQMMDRVRLVEAVHADVPFEVLLGAGPDSSRDVTPAHEHGHPFRTLTFETDRLFDADALTEVISKRLPRSVYRCKGFVNVDDGRPQRMLLQAVGRRTQLTSHDGTTAAPSQIVAIGTDELEMADLHAAFEECLT